jgi:hypothetical protein
MIICENVVLKCSDESFHDTKLDSNKLFFWNRGLPRFIDHKASSIQFSSESVSARPPTEDLKVVNLSSINIHYKLRTLLIHTDATVAEGSNIDAWDCNGLQVIPGGMLASSLIFWIITERI